MNQTKEKEKKHYLFIGVVGVFCVNHVQIPVLLHLSLSLSLTQKQKKQRVYSQGSSKSYTVCLTLACHVPSMLPGFKFRKLEFGVEMNQTCYDGNMYLFFSMCYYFIWVQDIDAYHGLVFLVLKKNHFILNGSILWLILNFTNLKV